MKNHRFITIITGLLLLFGISLTNCKVEERNSSESPLSEYQDTTPPTIDSVFPAQGATDIDADIAEITSTFSEPMDESSINTDSFTVSDGNSEISGTVTCNGKTASFAPSSILEGNTTYTATITDTVKDTFYNNIKSSFSWSFTAQPVFTQDDTTGLIWQDNGYEAQQNWHSADAYCSSLALGRYSDWRLPTRSELNGLNTRKSILNSFVANWYWTSETVYITQYDTWAAYTESFFDSDPYNARYLADSGGQTRCVRE